MNEEINYDGILSGILDMKLPISQSDDGSAVIHLKLRDGNRSMHYISSADARCDQKNLLFIKFKFPGTRNVKSYGQRQKICSGPHQITPEFLKDRDAYMKTLVEESKKSLKETVAIPSR